MKLFISIKGFKLNVGGEDVAKLDDFGYSTEFTPEETIESLKAQSEMMKDLIPILKDAVDLTFKEISKDTAEATESRLNRIIKEMNEVTCDYLKKMVKGCSKSTTLDELEKMVDPE